MNLKLILLLISISTIPVIGQDQYKNIYSETAWEERDKWQKPEEIIKYLQIKPGDWVADIGCHEGYMTFKLSTFIGEKGIVFAVDNRLPMIPLLQGKLKLKEIKNIKAIFESASSVHLPTDSVDAILILDTYHEIKDYQTVLINLKRSLKRGGRLLLCEAIAKERENSSRAKQMEKHELGIKYAKADLTEAGFRIETQKDLFVDRTKVKGDTMWLLVAIKD